MGCLLEFLQVFFIRTWDCRMFLGVITFVGICFFLFRLLRSGRSYFSLVRFFFWFNFRIWLCLVGCEYQKWNKIENGGEKKMKKTLTRIEKKMGKKFFFYKFVFVVGFGWRYCFCCWVWVDKKMFSIFGQFCNEKYSYYRRYDKIDNGF